MAKVFLALLDGLRPDSLTLSQNLFFRELMETSCYSMKMQAVMPSVTLPCHISLFHSVCAERHGILTNTYVPQVRPVNGICETLAAAGKNSAFFYTWEPLRDLARPLFLARSSFYSGDFYSYNIADKLVTEDAEKMLRSGDNPDFIFFYQGEVDGSGHKNSWMSDQYIQSVNNSLDNVQRVVKMLPPEYLVIITSDHGGHNRSHGCDLPEDMTIPLFLRHSSIASGEISGDVSILDVAPTVAKWLNIAPDPDWEGKSLI